MSGPDNSSMHHFFLLEQVEYNFDFIKYYVQTAMKQLKIYSLNCIFLKKTNRVDFNTANKQMYTYIVW